MPGTGAGHMHIVSVLISAGLEHVEERLQLLHQGLRKTPTGVMASPNDMQQTGPVGNNFPRYVLMGARTGTVLLVSRSTSSHSLHLQRGQLLKTNQLRTEKNCSQVVRLEDPQNPSSSHGQHPILNANAACHNCGLAINWFRA